MDAQNHFVIDISTTNDINDQNQLYIMAKDASDLLETEECTVVADTGYYNALQKPIIIIDSGVFEKHA